MADVADDSKDSVKARRPHIGAYVLETLTLGMYGEPRHTLREYVQNSFDAIRAAKRRKFLSDRGRVIITFKIDSIVIRDNGVGVPHEQAWTTLTSVGASKKDRQRDAGFRGIGRLAGMAYCDHLVFRTTFPGETVLTTIQFDCAKILKAVDPDDGDDEVELAKLLAENITSTYEDKAIATDHYFEVELVGLRTAPAVLTDVGQVRDYLSETVPVDFAPDWKRGAEIEAAYKANFGAPIDTIDVIVTTVDGQSSPIYKPYGDSYPLRMATAQLQSVEFKSSPDNLYWGWIGKLDRSGAVVESRTRGLRVRLCNIQVGGTEIFEGLFAQVKPSYGRFSAYYVGEIHVDPESVIPNARRDGFEETEEWSAIKRGLQEICRELAKEAYQVSNEGQSNVQKVIEEINGLVERSRGLAENSKATYDQVVELMHSAKRLRRKALAALKEVGDLDDTSVESGEPEEAKDLKAVALKDAAQSVEAVESVARGLIGQYVGEEERMAAMRLRLRQELLQEVLDVVNVFVDFNTYQRIKRELAKIV